MSASEDNLTRPADLPIYEDVAEKRYELIVDEPSSLEQSFKIVRESLLSAANEVSEVADKVNHVVETGKAHSIGAYNELLDEDNLLARVGVVTSSAALGLVIGTIRGRLLKRVVYTSLGAGIGSALCYPETAQTLSGDAYTEIRKKGLIAYNFINGVETTSGNVESSSLIASSINRFSRMLYKYFTETWDKHGVKIAKPTADDKEESSRKDTIIFEKGSDEISCAPVLEDPGQSRAEDKDLYTTRD